MATLNSPAAHDSTGAPDGARTLPAARVRRTYRRPPQPRVAYAIGVATVCSVALVNLVSGERATATVEPSASVAVADALGIDAPASDQAATPEDAELLGQLAASRAERDQDQAAAAAAQAEAERVAVEAKAAAERAAAEAAAVAAAQAEAQAAAAAAAEAAAAESAAAESAAAEAAAAETAAAPAAGPRASSSAPAAASAPVAPGTAASRVAQIKNSAGPIRPEAQTAANVVVSNVPGAAGITIGGTRASAADPGGHPSGLALDYMVMSDNALGDAIVAYHLAHWDTLGVDYIIWEQRYLASPGGSWRMMEDRGSATANHMDHPHVNYRG